MLLWMLAQYDNARKQKLLQYLSDNGACDAEHAIHLSGVDVSPSILSRHLVQQTTGGLYFLDPSRVHAADGASNSFILYAMGAFILAFFVIVPW